MRVILRNNKVVATCTNAYSGNEETMPAPEGFDLAKLQYYRKVQVHTVVFDEVLQEDVDVYTDEIQLKAPESVTMRQARLALLGAGLYAAVTPAINGIADVPTRTAALIEWEYAATINRNSALVTAMAGLLNLDEEDLDNLFTAAAAIAE